MPDNTPGGEGNMLGVLPRMQSSALQLPLEDPVASHPERSRNELRETRNSKKLLSERFAEDADPNNGSSLRGTLAVREISKDSAGNITEWDKKVHAYRLRCAKMLNTQKFDMGIGVVILLNSITIGWESQTEIEGGNTDAFAVLEHLFLVIYVFEIGARFFMKGPDGCDLLPTAESRFSASTGCQRAPQKAPKRTHLPLSHLPSGLAIFFAFGFLRSLVTSGWVLFDFLLVAVGVLSQWLIPIFFAATPAALEPILVLRVLRLLRLARAVRLIVSFKTLWMLVRGLLTSMDTIMFTFLLIGMTVYLTAVLGIEVITNNRSIYLHGDDDEGTLRKLLDENFNNLFSIMLTLLSFVTLDSISGIYMPMIKFQPLLFFYFIPFLLTVSIAMMNLVTAVLVQNAIESSENDKEVNAAYQKQKLEQIMPKVREIFVLLDEDKSGDISKDEIVKGLTENPELKTDLEWFMGSHSPLQLFEMLDVDGEGLIAIDEFCDALLSRITSTAPVEVTRILKLVTQMKADLQKSLQQKGSGGEGGQTTSMDDESERQKKKAEERAHKLRSGMTFQLDADGSGHDKISPDTFHLLEGLHTEIRPGRGPLDDVGGEAAGWELAVPTSARSSRLPMSARSLPGAASDKRANYRASEVVVSFPTALDEAGEYEARARRSGLNVDFLLAENTELKERVKRMEGRLEDVYGVLAQVAQAVVVAEPVVGDIQKEKS
eukprot:g18071.t1